MARRAVRVVRGTAAIVLAICASYVWKADRAHAAGAGQRFQQVEIVDSTGFERPIPAMRGLVPAGWVARGGVVWSPQAQCGADGVQIQWGAWDPVSGAAVETLPAIAWQANNLPIQMPPNTGGAHCLHAPITTVRAYLEALVQIVRPGAQVLDFRPQPELLKIAGMEPTRDMLPGGEMRSWAEAGDLLIGYDVQGRNFREVIRGIAVFFTSTMQGVMPGEIRHFLTGSSLPAFGMRAPDGSLDFRLFDSVHRSFRMDPEWGARMAKHNAEMSRINTKGAADRHAIRMQTNREISDMMNKSWADRQASQDRTQEKFVRAIRGVELYADPAAGRPVELPNTYDHAWRLQDGTYMMTDNPNFDPNVEFGVNGTRLQVIR